MNLIRIQKALAMALEAHSGQFRKSKDIPYVTHPLTVAITLAQAGAPEDAIIAGILHDTIEDTSITYEQIEAEFGTHVADLVQSVTEPKGLTWVNRKRAVIKRIPTFSHESVLIKSADVLHNLSDSLNDYERTGKMFLRGQQVLHYTDLVRELAKRRGNNSIVALAQAVLEKLPKPKLTHKKYSVKMDEVSTPKKMKVPAYFELNGKIAKMERQTDGRVWITVPANMSIADFMQDGTQISESDYQRLARDAAKDKAV